MAKSKYSSLKKKKQEDCDNKPSQSVSAVHETVLTTRKNKSYTPTAVSSQNKDFTVSDTINRSDHSYEPMDLSL